LGDKVPIEVKALGKALLFGIITCIALAGIVYYSSLQETLLATLGKLVLIASVFYAGCYTSKAYGNKGLIRGITMGVLFFIVLLIASLIFHAEPIRTGSFFTTLASCVGAGAIGGIFGLGLNPD